MPLFRYNCPDCGAEFELLLARFDSRAECPRCGSEKIERQINKIGAIGAGNKNRCSRKEQCADGGHHCCGGCCCGHH